ncbi:hypothetical protein EJB05_48709, partial [Eragrostis curvula]
MDASPRPATTTTITSPALPTASPSGCTSFLCSPPPTKTSSSTANHANASMSFRLGRVASDLSHSSHRKAKDHGVRHQSTSNNENSSNASGKAKQRILLLFTGVSAWRRSDGTGTGDTGRSTKSKKKKQTEENSKRRGLDIGHAVWKYLSMVEQLFTSSSGGGRKSERPEPRRRRHTFVSSRGSGNNDKAPSKRHRGRLSSAPASLRGSPANSGHLSVGESVKMSTSSSELSTMEELQSAIQAAIAHCKSSVAVARQAPAGGDDGCFQFILVVFFSTSILLSKHICKILCLFNVYSAVNSRLASVDLWEEIILRGQLMVDVMLQNARIKEAWALDKVMQAIGALAFGPVDPHEAV